MAMERLTVAARRAEMGVARSERVIPYILCGFGINRDGGAGCGCFKRKEENDARTEKMDEDGGG